MWIDEGLNWKAHIAKVSSTLSKTVGVLFKIRNYVSMPCLKIFYYSFIQSKLIYGTLTWEGTTKENLSHLSTTQHKTLRSITCSPRRLNLTKLYKKCEILQQDKLYTLEVAKFVFRFHNDAMPSQFTSMYNNINKIHSYNTRSSKDQNLFLPKRESSLAIKRSIKFIYLFYLLILLTDSKKIGPAVQRRKHNYTLITPKHTQSFKQDRFQSFVLASSVYRPS